MKPSPHTWTRLEKAALDNGFDLEGPRVGDWRSFTSSQTTLKLWLTGLGDAVLVVAFSRWEVFEALEGLGIVWTNPLPPGAIAARSTGDLAGLYRLIRRAFQLSRALPHEPLEVFERRTQGLPRTTEAERLVVQRVGQDIFRGGLIDYWEGRCAVTGLAVVELLRASHIKPWSECDTDAERLDVYNGLLLAPHLDALFDRGFMTVADDGTLLLAETLDLEARIALGLTPPLRISKLTEVHRRYLHWHRAHLFRVPTPT